MHVRFSTHLLWKHFYFFILFSIEIQAPKYIQALMLMHTIEQVAEASNEIMISTHVNEMGFFSFSFSFYPSVEIQCMLSILDILFKYDDVGEQKAKNKRKL